MAEIGPDCEIGGTNKLFKTGLVVLPDTYQYDVSADGERFLLFQESPDVTSAPITVIANCDWTSLEQ